jgi:hypothetical protein
MKGRRKAKPSLRMTVEFEASRDEARALAQRLEETARLERARGEQVEQAQGKLRITSRDGLLTLLERGGLERPDYEAGRRHNHQLWLDQAGSRRFVRQLGF